MAALAALSIVATTSVAVGRPLSGDEVASAIVISRPGPVAALLQIARGESAPPLWYGVAWLLHFGGVPIVWIRVLSIVAMAAAVALTALFAWISELGFWTGTLGGALAAVGQQYVERGGELRAYSLFCLLSVLFAIGFTRAAERPDRRRCWTVSLLVAMGSLAHYYFLLSVLAAVIWLVVHPEARSHARRLARHIAIGLLPLLAWTPVILHQYRTARYDWIRHVSAHLLESAASNLFVDPWVTRSVSSYAYLVGPIVATVGIAVLVRTPTGRLCALLGGVPVVTSSIAWMVGVPIFDVRNLIGAAPFVAIAIAACLTRVGRVSVPVGVAVVAVLVAGQVDARIHLHRTDFGTVAASLVGQGWTPQEPIGLFGPLYGSVALGWYLPGHPRLDQGTIRLAGCRRLFVVAEQSRGRTWVRRNLPGGFVRRVAAYGSGELGPRGAPILVGSVTLSDATLASARAAGMRALGVRGTPGCVTASPS